MTRPMAASIVTDTEFVNQRWQTRALPLALVLVTFSIVMYDTGSSLLDLWWHSDGYGHGIVVLGVTVYLLYLRRAEIVVERTRTSVLGLLLAVALMSVWSLSRILGVLIGEQVLLVLILPSIVMALYGARMAKIVALPILYLFCAIPLWSYLVPLLQESTAQAATAMSRALGVPIYLEGIYMTIPDGVFLVAEVCAGISYLLAALSLGGFYALLNLRAVWTRIAIVLLSVVAGVVFNWIRVTGIVLIGHHSKMQSEFVREHITYGWVLFVLVVVFIMVCGRLLERAEAQDDETAEKARDVDDRSRINERRVWAMAISCALVLAVPAYASMRFITAPQSVPAVALSTLLGQGGGWQFAAPPTDGWTAFSLGADSHARASYAKAQQRVDVHVGYFSVQRQGAEAVSDRHTVYDFETWTRIAQKAVVNRASVAPDMTVNEVSIRQINGANGRLVWWWYWVDEQFTADKIEAKQLQMRSLFSGKRAAAMIALSSPLFGDVAKTREAMKSWLLEAAGPLAANLRGMSGADSP
ncbi:MAG: exosortase A [Gammaproteobacteria bacterium]|jgi:exosortase A